MMEVSTFTREEILAATREIKLQPWVEALSDANKRKLAASFNNPADYLRVIKELQTSCEEAMNVYERGFNRAENLTAQKIKDQDFKIRQLAGIINTANTIIDSKITAIVKLEEEIERLRQRFIAVYAKRGDISVGRLQELGQDARRCDCDEGNCLGWQMVSISETQH